MKKKIKLIPLLTVLLMSLTLKAQHVFELEQSIKNDSLCIDVFFTNNNIGADTLGTSNLVITLDTNALFKNSVNISFRGNYDISSGYFPMVIAPTGGIVNTFFSLNIKNDNTGGYAPAAVVREKIATICFQIKDPCVTSGVTWKTTFPFGSVLDYDGTLWNNPAQYVKNGGDPNFSLSTPIAVYQTDPEACDSIIFNTNTYYSSTFVYDTLVKGVGCGDSIIVTQLIVNASPLVNLGNDTSLCVGESIKLSSIISSEEMKIVASDRFNSDRFGRSVAISGEWAIVGAYVEDENEVGLAPLGSAGSAYIYKWNGVKWIQMQKIVASDRGGSDRFGESVAISNDKIIVGAFFEESQAGAAYIFERDAGGVWNEVQKIIASDRSNFDHFGVSVSISGNKVVIGADSEREDENGLNSLIAAGSAYIYERDAGGVWTQVKKIVAMDRAADDGFGGSVSISGDRIVIGAKLEDEDASGGATLTSAGSAYIFERLNGDWVQIQKIVASDRLANPSLDNFGSSVAIDGNRLVVGALFDDYDLAGSNLQNKAGSAYIFEWNGALWVEKNKITPSDRFSLDLFGNSVSISGNRVLIGASGEDIDGTMSNDGAAYIFEWNGANWIENQKITSSDRSSADVFGGSVSISGDRVFFGAEGEDEDENGGTTLSSAGSAYIMQPISKLWSTAETSDTINITLTSDTTIWLKVTSLGGCVSRDSIFIIGGTNPNPKPKLGIDVNVCGDSVYFVSDIKTTVGKYIWYNNNFPIDTFAVDNDSVLVFDTDFFPIVLSLDSAGNGCFMNDTINASFILLNNHTIDPDTIFFCDSTNINTLLQSSDLNVNYYIRSEIDSSYVAGPFEGVGGAMFLFDDKQFISDASFNILAVSRGTAIDLNGINDNVNRAIPSITTANLTLEASFVARNPGGGGNQMIVYNGNSGLNGYGMFIDGIGGKLQLLFGGLAVINTDYTVVSNQWTHIAIAASTTNDWSVYVNGELVFGPIVTGGPNVPAAGGFFAGSNPQGADFFDGRIDNVRFWNTELNQTQITDNILNCVQADANLIVNYDFEDDINTFLVRDKSGNGNDGTATNPLSGGIVGLNNCTSCNLEMTTQLELIKSFNPKPNLGLDDTLCHDFMFGTNSYYEVSNIQADVLGSYEWFKNGFQEFVNDDSLALFNGGFGSIDTIILRLDSAGNGCFKYDTVALLILEEYDPLVFIDTLCEGSFVNYNIMGGMHDNYDWYLNGNLELSTTNNIYDTTISLNDTVIVIATGGFSNGVCPDIFTDTIVKGVHPPINATLTNINDTSLCVGDTSKLLATPLIGATYEWFDGTGSLTTGLDDSLKFYENPETYYTVITDTNFCTDTTNTKKVILTPSLKVDLRVLLEGPYDSGGNMFDSLFSTTDTIGTNKILENQFEHPSTSGGSGFGGAYGIIMKAGINVPNNSVDVVQLSLRNTPNGADLDTTYAWLMEDGSLQNFKTADSSFALVCNETLFPGDYHVVVRHRNHLTIMTKDSIFLNTTGIPANYDMTNVNNIYNASVGDIGSKDLGAGLFGMFGGNADPYMQIDAADLNKTHAIGTNNLLQGYHNEDFDLDGGVNAIDVTKTSISNNNLYFSTTPNP